VSTAVRPAVDPDGILGLSPRFAAEPASVREAADALRSFAGDRLAVTFVGGGTDLELGAAPSRLDAVLRTRRLSRVVEYAPSDQIVAVEAGMTLAELQRHLAAQGQRLALDPPLPDRATVGGIVAANAFGPMRARFGVARDLVIGITLIRGDGVVARGGGKVVKNVAGFDLPRLFCGSLGTLGLIAEVVFRLHPLPETAGTVLFDGLSASEVRALARSALEAHLEPVAVVAISAGNRYRLAFRLEGFAPGVRDQTERLAGIAGRAGERLEGGNAAALWARHDELRTAGDVRLKASFAPASMVAVEPALRSFAAALEDDALVLYPTFGCAFVSGWLTDPRAAASAIESVRAAVRSANGSAVIAAAPPALRARVDVWGPPPSAIAVMRQLKAQLDPDSRLSPGRFVGGL
jgi:glycolate oxidase FAD binding subunit